MMNRNAPNGLTIANSVLCSNYVRSCMAYPAMVHATIKNPIIGCSANAPARIRAETVTPTTYPKPASRFMRSIVKDE